jgi:hypothetical protein
MMIKHKNTVFSNLILLLFVIIFTAGCKPDSSKKISVENTGVQNIIADENKLLSYYKKIGDYYQLEWPILLRTKFEEKYVDTMSMEVSLPIFTDTLMALHGKMVEVEGFFIPVSETGDDKIVIVSAFPFAQCFFCGKAGVESIIDILSPKKMPHLKLDAKIKFRGRLKLNRDNFDYLIYVLEEAELVE